MLAVVSVVDELGICVCHLVNHLCFFTVQNPLDYFEVRCDFLEEKVSLFRVDILDPTEIAVCRSQSGFPVVDRFILLL